MQTPESSAGEETDEDGAMARQSHAAATDEIIEQMGAAYASWQEGRRVSPEEFLAPPRWIERLPRKLAVQTGIPSRRPLIPGRASHIHWRRTIRRWSRRGGAGLGIVRRPHNRQPSRMVLLWDVSGSMSEVRDVSLAFAYGLVSRVSGQVAVFPFGTRVDDVTQVLRQPFPVAQAALARVEKLWAGGTDIGGVLTDWIARFGSRWLRPSTTVMILSDGWDIGQPEVLERAMRTMYGAGSRIYWLNPLQATPGFVPRTRALRAAQPYVSGMFAAAEPEDFLRFTRHETLSR